MHMMYSSVAVTISCPAQFTALFHWSASTGTTRQLFKQATSTSLKIRIQQYIIWICAKCVTQ